MVVPSIFTTELAKDVIIDKYGLTPLAHPWPEYIKSHLPTWNAVRLPIWNRLAATIDMDYNPIHNYDRTELAGDITKFSRANRGAVEDTGSSTENQDGTGSSDQLNEISAENESTWSNDTQVSGSRRDTMDISRDTRATSTTRSSEKNVEDHGTVLRAYGNIGVTTTQQMIQAQRDLVRFSLLDEIADDFFDEFCLSIY